MYLYVHINFGIAYTALLYYHYVIPLLLALGYWWRSSREEESDMEESKADSGSGENASLESDWSQLWVWFLTVLKDAFKWLSLNNI